MFESLQLKKALGYSNKKTGKNGAAFMEGSMSFNPAGQRPVSKGPAVDMRDSALLLIKGNGKDGGEPGKGL